MIKKPVQVPNEDQDEVQEKDQDKDKEQGVTSALQ